MQSNSILYVLFWIILSYDMHGMISWIFKKHDPELNWAKLRHRLYIINMHHNNMQMQNKTAVAFDISDQGFVGRSPSWFPTRESRVRLPVPLSWSCSFIIIISFSEISSTSTLVCSWLLETKADLIWLTSIFSLKFGQKWS